MDARLILHYYEHGYTTYNDYHLMKRGFARSGTQRSITHCDLKEVKDGTLVLSDMRPLIHDIRGVQVMLDRDLAAAYQVSTAAFNQAVKRNANRFPESFRFQLTKEEHEILISQIVTSKRASGEETRGGYHKLPFAFTEQGIAMLSVILRSDVAVSVSIRLMNTFVAMRKTLSSLVPVMTLFGWHCSRDCQRVHTFWLCLYSPAPPPR